MVHQHSQQHKQRRKKIADIFRKHLYLVHWDLNPLTEEQLNQQRALKFYLRIIAYEDKVEIVNTQTLEMTMGLLTDLFGVYDSAVVPSDAFDGCVTVDKRLVQT
jgi:hypothetical protein